MCDEKRLAYRIDELEEKLTDLIDYVYDIGAKDVIDYIKKNIYKVSEDGTYYDEVDGYHSPGDCYSPKGHYCGECSRRSCAHCGYTYLEEEEWEDE